MCDTELRVGITARGGRMSTISVSAEVMSALDELATARGTDVPGVLAEAIGLEQALVDAQRSGGLMLIAERHGRLREVIPQDSD